MKRTINSNKKEQTPVTPDHQGNLTDTMPDAKAPILYDTVRRAGTLGDASCDETAQILNCVVVTQVHIYVKIHQAACFRSVPFMVPPIN